MAYQAILTYTRDGAFVGYAINKTGTAKLHGSNLYVDGEEEELQKQLNRLNDAENIQKFWPDGNDPEVVALLLDPNFEPSTGTETITVPVLDQEASTIVFDDQGIPLEDESDLVYHNTTITQPTNSIERGHKALETVARRRAARG